MRSLGSWPTNPLRPPVNRWASNTARPAALALARAAKSYQLRPAKYGNSPTLLMATLWSSYGRAQYNRPMRLTGKTCGCGAAIVLLIVSGMEVERCHRTGETACSAPQMKPDDGAPERGQRRPQATRHTVLLNTSTAPGGSLPVVSQLDAAEMQLFHDDPQDDSWWVDMPPALRDEACRG